MLRFAKQPQPASSPPASSSESSDSMSFCAVVLKISIACELAGWYAFPRGSNLFAPAITLGLFTLLALCRPLSIASTILLALNYLYLARSIFNCVGTTLAATFYSTEVILQGLIALHPGAKKHQEELTEELPTYLLIAISLLSIIAVGSFAQVAALRHARRQASKIYSSQPSLRLHRTNSEAISTDNIEPSHKTCQDVPLSFNGQSWSEVVLAITISCNITAVYSSPEAWSHFAPSLVLSPLTLLATCRPLSMASTLLLGLNYLFLARSILLSVFYIPLTLMLSNDFIAQILFAMQPHGWAGSQKELAKLIPIANFLIITYACIGVVESCAQIAALCQARRQARLALTQQEASKLHGDQFAISLSL